jgi:hypothetical protein
MPNDAKMHCTECIDTFLNANTGVIVACPKATTAPADLSAFQEFDPPVTVLTYKDSKAASRNGTRPQNVQAEHPIPNSCFMVGTGRTGATVPNVGVYCEGDALTFWVEDDQSHGTEHKFLTDKERELCVECFNKKQFPTIEQWFRYMENNWKEAFLGFRTYVGPKGANPQETANLKEAAAGRAAYALRKTLEDHYYKTLTAKDDARLRNGIVSNAPAPSSNLKKNQEYNEF